MVWAWSENGRQEITSESSTLLREWEIE